MAYYTWAPIRYGAEKDDQGVITKVLIRGVGQEVNQGDLDMSDEEWNYMLSNGVIREQEYPISQETIAAGGTLEAPREALLREAKEKMTQAESLAAQVEGGETPTGSEAVRSGAAPGRT